MNIRLAAVIIFLTGSLTLARAEDTVAVMQQAQGSLDYTLNSLRASVVRLTEENRNLTAANRDVAAKIPLLNEQLKALQADEAKTRAQFQALEERYQKKMAVIAALETRYQQARDSGQLAVTARAALEKETAAKRSDELALTAQLDALTRDVQNIHDGITRGDDRSDELGALRQEQAALQKELESGTVVLNGLRTEWREASVLVNAGPGQTDALRRDRARLLADFVQRNRTLAGTRDRVAAEKTKTEALSAHVCAGESLPGLEKAVAALNTEVTRAQRSVDDLQRKSSTHADKMAGTAGDQRRKDTARVRDLEETNRLMKAELNRLQHEMVSLDRKKAVLEKDIGM